MLTQKLTLISQMKSRVTIEKKNMSLRYVGFYSTLYNRPTQGTLYETRVTQYQCLCDLKH